MDGPGTRVFSACRARDEAFIYWQQLALESSSSTEGHIELAKHFEWHTANLPLAAEWTRTALSQASNWPQGMLRDLEIKTLEHRLRRLERKMRRNPPD